MKNYKTPQGLLKLDNSELISEILKLQKVVSDMEINEAVCSQIHNYHFSSNELLKFGLEYYRGSGLILGGVFSLSGKQLMKPITISDGLSNETINSILDDLKRTFDYKIELKPTDKRL